jgi:hypothetical protein
MWWNIKSQNARESGETKKQPANRDQKDNRLRRNARCLIYKDRNSSCVMRRTRDSTTLGQYGDIDYRAGSARCHHPTPSLVSGRQWEGDNLIRIAESSRASRHGLFLSNTSNILYTRQCGLLIVLTPRWTECQRGAIIYRHLFYDRPIAACESFSIPYNTEK